MAAGVKHAWVPPHSWPTPPAGWRPTPGWEPDPSWPEPPPDWQWWQERLDPRSFLLSWWFAVGTVAVFAVGNIAMAGWLWHLEAATRHFWLSQSEGASLSLDPLALVGYTVLLLLTLGVATIAWLASFGLRRFGWRSAATTAVLFVSAALIEAYDVVIGPDATVGQTWWGSRNINGPADQIGFSAAISGGAAVAGLMLIAIAVQRRRRLLGESATTQQP